MTATSSLALIVLSLCMTGSGAWSPSHQPPPRSRAQITPRLPPAISLAAANDDDGPAAPPDELLQDKTNEESAAVYGVSYIGGDPCGSRYNDDPFDATKEEAFKPGLPDDMRERIAALAARKAAEAREREE